MRIPVALRDAPYEVVIGAGVRRELAGFVAAHCADASRRCRHHHLPSPTHGVVSS